MPQLNIYVIVVLLITNVFTFGLWRHEANSITAMELRGQVAQEQADAKTRAQEQITEDTANGWKAALDSVRADYARRMRNNGAHYMPGLSKPANGIDGIPADAMALAADCAETTAQLITLQGWVRHQESAK